VGKRTREWMFPLFLSFVLFNDLYHRQSLSRNLLHQCNTISIIFDIYLKWLKVIFYDSNMHTKHHNSIDKNIKEKEEKLGAVNCFVYNPLIMIHLATLCYVIWNGLTKTKSLIRWVRRQWPNTIYTALRPNITSSTQ
jgi:hypothetical protein